MYELNELNINLDHQAVSDLKGIEIAFSNFISLTKIKFSAQKNYIKDINPFAKGIRHLNKLV